MHAIVSHDNEITYYFNAKQAPLAQAEAEGMDIWHKNPYAQMWQLMDGTDAEANVIAEARRIGDWYDAGGWDL